MIFRVSFNGPQTCIPIFQLPTIKEHPLQAHVITVATTVGLQDSGGFWGHPTFIFSLRSSLCDY